MLYQFHTETTNLDDHLIHCDLVNRAIKLLEELDTTHKSKVPILDALILNLHEGWSTYRIAELYGASHDTVSKMINRGIEHLKKNLGDDWDQVKMK